MLSGVLLNAALGPALHDAEALLFARFGEVTLAMLSADVHERPVEHHLFDLESGGLA